MFTVAPRDHYVAPVIGHGGFEIQVGGGGQPGHTAPHAEPGNPQPAGTDAWAPGQEVYRRVNIGDYLRVAEKTAAGLAGARRHIAGNPLAGNPLVGNPMEQVGRDGGVPLGGQAIGELPDKPVHTGRVMDYHHNRGCALAFRLADVSRHRRPGYIQLLPMARHMRQAVTAAPFRCLSKKSTVRGQAAAAASAWCRSGFVKSMKAWSASS